MNDINAESIIGEELNKSLIALAHEVKNPVSLIKANIELLEFQGTFNDNQYNVDIIKKELNKISKIVTDFNTLFCYNNINKLDDINLVDIIKEVEKEYRVTNKLSNISFYLNSFCKFEESFINGDETKLGMLFSNIYKNAIESVKENNYEDNNNIIRTNIYVKNNNRIVVEIIDNGHGIKKEIENNICEPFNTTKSSGTGLGLSICKNIVNNFEGEFSIENNANSKGCIVKIEFKINE